MAMHLRLIQLEMYLPHVSSNSELLRALSPLKRFCKEQHNIAMTIEDYDDTDRGEFSLVVIGSSKRNVEQESEHLLSWIETKITGQTLASNISWL
jgi:uncharacterized protein YlxP (DUF503 family)